MMDIPHWWRPTQARRSCPDRRHGCGSNAIGLAPPPARPVERLEGQTPRGPCSDDVGARACAAIWQSWLLILGASWRPRCSDLASNLTSRASVSFLTLL